MPAGGRAKGLGGGVVPRTRSPLILVVLQVLEPGVPARVARILEGRMRRQRPALGHQTLEERVEDRSGNSEVPEERPHDLSDLTGGQRELDFHLLALLILDVRITARPHLNAQDMARAVILVSRLPARSSDDDIATPEGLVRLIGPLHWDLLVAGDFRSMASW